MQANDQVPAPQGNATHGFYWSGQPLRANLVASEALRWPKSRHDPGNLGYIG
jgi:hypothetical protein